MADAKGGSPPTMADAKGGLPLFHHFMVMLFTGSYAEMKMTRRVTFPWYVSDRQARQTFELNKHNKLPIYI